MIKTRPREVAKEKIRNIVIPAQEKEKFGRIASSAVNRIKYDPLFREGSLVQIRYSDLSHVQRQLSPIHGRVIKAYDHFLLIQTKEYPISVSWIDIYIGEVRIMPWI